MKRIWLSIALSVFSAAPGLSRVEAQTNLPVYGDGFATGWDNWSWAANHPTNQPAHSGSVALAVTAGAWEAAYFHHDALVANQYTNLVLWIHGGPQGGQKLQVSGLLSGQAQGSTNLPALPANTWQEVRIPLTALGVAGASDFDGFWVADRAGKAQATFYLDDLVLLAGTPPPPATNTAVAVAVDAGRNRRPISPLIYGVAFAEADELHGLNATLNRSGGNSESRYNWQINAHNRGADWYFESLADSPATPGAEADQWVSASQSGGAEAMLTIPMVGWVPKLGPSRGRLASFSIAKYGPQSDADYAWFKDAGNGLRASDGKNITGNDPNDANQPADVAFQQGWVAHLTNRWGTAGRGGVRWYFMDNEPSIWHATHRDVHPTGATMAEVRDKLFAYGAMVKDLDPNALVAGPEEWGWSGYFYSGFDQQAGSANGWSSFPDRAANGGWDYLPWYLDQARQQATTTGRRVLDYFTVHYYPQGGEYASSTSTALQLRRNRSTRSLWDPAYTDETWINDKVRLIPRLRQWVDTYYPGTKIGLTEYNWGAESHINGATAQADLLGIFGREGLDLATRWTTPPTNSPVYNAMKLYRNYDNAGSTFGETSVQAGGPNPDELAVFAAERAADGALTVVLVHKRLDSVTPVSVALTNFPAAGTAQVWQLNASNRIDRLADVALTNGVTGLALAGQGVTLLVVGPARALRLETMAQDPPGLVRFRVQGPAGRLCRVEQSPDLGAWQPVLTNTLNGGEFVFEAPKDAAPARFFRAATLP